MNTPLVNRGRWLALAAGLSLAVPAAAVDQVIAEGEKRVQENTSAQAEVDKLDDRKRDLVAEYATALKVVDGLKVYNALLRKQVDNQQSELAVLADSMDKVSVIERQITPLMLRMVEGLDEFVRLDVPFLAEERSKRIGDLRAMMERADVTAAEKFRRVIEAFQIENDYGRTLEAYRGTLEVDGTSQQVDFLRVGRVALLYQSPGGERSGRWNQGTRSWETLSGAEFRVNIARGLAMARKQSAPDLLVLPVAAAEGVGQ